MKKITNLFMLLAIALFVACDEPIDTTVPTLKVTPYNLDGSWKLESLSGNQLASGTYVYLVLDSRSTFEIYDNTSSMYPTLFTGKFELEEDWRVGDVISGTYDYEQGAWAHQYVVTDLYKESMVWTAKDDSTYVQKFVRVEEVPTEIVELARKPLE